MNNLRPDDSSESITQHITPGQMDDDRFEREMAFARKSHTHLWGAVVPYKISEAALSEMTKGEPVHLDRENMLSYPLVGCLVCEEPFTPALRRRRCPGDPR